MNSEIAAKARRLSTLPAVLLLTGLCLSVAAGLWQRSEVSKDAKVEFERIGERVSADITRRFRRPIDGLYGAKALYAASKKVTRVEFRDYVEARELSKNFPGVRGFGFIQRVMNTGLDPFIAAERADGAPQFAVRQLADKDHADLFVIKLIEPAGNNVGAQGLDIGSEKLRRAAAETAVDSGEPTITAGVTLVQDQRKTPGVLIFVPVYAKGAHPTNAAERRVSLVGLLYAPVVIAELLDGMPDVQGAHGIDVDLYDTAPGTSGTLIYDLDNHARQLAAQTINGGSRFAAEMPLTLIGRELTLKVRGTPGFDAAVDYTTAWLVFAGGTLISALLAILVRQQIEGRSRAEVLAQQMTEQLRQDQERARDFSESASDWFWETDAQHRFCYFSDNFEAVYKMAPGRLLGKSRKELLELDKLNPSAPIEAHLAQLHTHQPFKHFEYRIYNEAGEIVWVTVSGKPYVDKDGRFAGYRGTGSLITEHKQMLELLQGSEARHRALFEHSKIPMLLIDPKDGAIVDANQAAARFYGYSTERLRTMFMSEVNELSSAEILAEMTLAKSEQRDCFYFQHRLASGAIREVEVRSGPLEIDGRELLYSVINDVTEQRAAQMALVTETARLHALLETASDGIHILDMNGNLIQFSHSFATMLGYADQEISGFNVGDWDALIPKGKLGDTIRELIRAPARFETRHRCKDGQLIDVEIHAKGIEIGGEQFLYASSRDITERKQSDAIAAELGRQVGQLSQRLSLAADAAHIGVWDYAVRENQLVWDKWMFALYGVREEDFSGAYEAWRTGLHPDDVKRGDDEIDQALRGEKEFDTEFRVKWPNGEVKYIKAAAMVLRDAEGRPLRMIGVNYDITERKDYEKKLESAELLMRSSIEALDEAFVLYDPDDRLVFCNEKYRQIYSDIAHLMVPGVSFETLIRRGAEQGHYSDAIGRVDDWVNERLAAHLASNSTLIQKHTNGRTLRIIERKTADGYIVGFRIDITELVQAMEDAQAANVAKSRFLATMSHELRTPMNGILGMAQMLHMPDIKDDERQDYARTILSSGQTLLTLLNDILDLSKVEAGKIELESVGFDPAQIVHEIQSLFSEAAKQKGLRIDSVWSGPAQHYLGDPHRLRQMLSNLTGNALKFTAKGKISLEAQEVECDGERSLLEFAVSDTGVGIPEDKLGLLFKPFSQADSSTTRQFGGTGLGLSLVRSMAMLMGGDVGLDSTPGAGSRFWFRIPADLLTPGANSRDDARKAIVGAEGTAMDVNAKSFAGHILVVDDNPTNRLVLKAMLNQPGVRCDFAENGQQALDMITDPDGIVPDLVLMDCRMPVLDGYDATMRIRRWEAENAQPHLTIVALTASAFEDDRKRCLDAGMDDFLAKPIDIEKLTAMLGHWLAGSREMVEVTDAARTPQAAITRRENDPPVFDAETLLAQLGGDRELAKAIIQSAMEDIPGYFGQLEHAIAISNWKTAERQTHTMKGLTAQIGGIKLSARMKEVDDHLNGGGTTDSATVIDLRREYQTLSATLLEWIR